MAKTLDALLDATGVSDLRMGFTKSAAPEVADDYFLKLAERCDRAADAKADDLAAAKDRGIAEKTAAVAVIRRTLSEIAALEGPGIKLAADDTRHAEFIHTALVAGHKPEEIAVFLSKQATAAR